MKRMVKAPVFEAADLRKSAGRERAAKWTEDPRAEAWRESVFDVLPTSLQDALRDADLDSATRLDALAGDVSHEEARVIAAQALRCSVESLGQTDFDAFFWAVESAKVLAGGMSRRRANLTDAEVSLFRQPAQKK